MKRLALLIIFLLGLLPGVAQAQARLSREDINRIAQSVVQIIALRGGQPYASGSGTIIDARGTIYTNQHVVEDADDFMIYMLEDSSEAPVHRYYAYIVREFADADFAILQIDRDANRRPVGAADLNLPFLTPAPADVGLGDRIFVFGYPDIGGGYLVFTEGTVSSIQNGTIAGQRLPAWYQTDAEIAPGNSGGLAVNDQGQPVGIPTAVRTDERTGGRLGGILPFQAVLALVDADRRGVIQEPPPSPQQTDRQLQVQITHVEQDTYAGDANEAGVTVYSYIRATGYRGIPLRVGIFYYAADGTAISGANAVAENRTPSGALTIQQVVTPEYDDTEWPEYWFWMPYSSFPQGASGARGASAQIEIGIDGQEFLATSDIVTLGGSSAPAADELNYTLLPNYGTLDLAAGFLPDPATLSVRAGGSVNVSYLGGSCVGYASPAPDLRLNWSGTSRELRIFFEAATAGGDATLIVNNPAGDWFCVDDANANTLNPMVVLRLPRPGQYDIWVGTYEPNIGLDGRLSITETNAAPR